MARPPSSRTVLSPLSRRLVAGLLIAAGILLVIAQLLRVYVLFYHWHDLGQLAWRPVLGVVLGTAAGALTSYVGWRVGRAG